MEIFSNRLKELRQNLPIDKRKQTDVAKILGISAQSYSTYENGREPNFEILCKIADYFNVSIDYLLGREKEFESIQQLDEFMERDYTIETGPFWDDLGKGYYARVVEIPAIIVYERTESKARVSLNDAKREWGYRAIKDGVDIPKPKLMEV